MSAEPRLHPAVVLRLAELSSGPRRLLGIVGPPGSGKSTLAEWLVAAVPERAQALPMDGYHLAQQELHRLGRSQRKGAPDTFDASGYAALLRRLRQQRAPGVIYAPDFRRDLEEPVAGALPLEALIPLVITEGNYLLLDEGDWAAVAPLLDEVWYLVVDPSLRLARLCARHQRFGRSATEAQAWIAQTDEPNARRIEATRHRAHRWVGLDAETGLVRFLTPHS